MLRLQFIRVLGETNACSTCSVASKSCASASSVLALSRSLRATESSALEVVASISLPFHELHLVLELQLVLGEACVRLGKLHTVGGAYFDSGDQHQGVAPSSGGESPLVTFPLPPIPRGVWTARCLDTSSKKGERSAPLLRTYRDELEAKRGVSSHRRSPSD